MISSKMVKVFVTHDGREFINYADAFEHEKRLAVEAWAEEHLALDHETMQEVIDTIMERKEQLLKALQKGDTPC